MNNIKLIYEYNDIDNLYGLNWQIKGIVSKYDLYHLIEHIRHSDYAIGIKKPHELNSLRKHDKLFEKYLKIIQLNPNKLITLHTKNKRDRFVIYMICKLLRFKYKRITQPNCSSYAPWYSLTDKNPNVCGCAFAAIHNKEVMCKDHVIIKINKK